MARQGLIPGGCTRCQSCRFWNRKLKRRGRRRERHEARHATSNHLATEQILR